MIFQHRDLDAGQMFFHLREIALAAAGVDNDEKRILFGGFGRARDHQIVDHAAVLIEQKRITNGARLQILEFAGHQAFGARADIVAFERDLPHMRDVEQAAGGAGVQMFFYDAIGILHGHFEAGERHHFAVQADMQVVKRRALEGNGQIHDGNV